MNNVFLKPPQLKNDSGETRKVGFEIEFAAQDCVGIAKKLQSLFGGQLERVNPHFYNVLDSRLGTFCIHLDTQYVHPELEEGLDAGSLDEFFNEVKASFCEILGDIGKAVVPYEVVTAPIPMDRLDELTDLVNGLKELGVEGTDEGLVYAFGVHINPEAPSLEARSILNHLRAFLLLSEWLHKQMNIDLARRLSPYIKPFPRSYAIKILSPRYQPDISTLIDDYLLDNPTRNRELDLLPLFTHLDEARVLNRLQDGLTSARPTYHYRLPDCRLNDPGWSLAREWSLWVKVEELAHDREKLEAMSAAYIEHFEGRPAEAPPPDTAGTPMQDSTGAPSGTFFSEAIKQILPGDWSVEVKKWMDK